MQRTSLIALSLGLAAAAAGAAYAQIGARADTAAGQSLADATARRAAAPRLAAAPAIARPAAAPAVTAKLAPPLYPRVTEDDVYDVDSFGRNVRWLGLDSAYIYLLDGCPKPTSDMEYCQQVNTAPGGVTSFVFNDTARIKLPKGATNSLLCYWFSPLLTVSYHNPNAFRVVGRFRFSPTLTIENPVLDDPSLVDPTTGVPFGGQLLTGMTSAEIFQESLEPGVFITERSRDSTVCIAGFITHRALINSYGLTPAQADAFFASPTTVRLNVSGSAQYVPEAVMTLGLRIVGD